jgi:hypothetical protein
MMGLGQDLLALEAEERHQRRQQRDQRHRPEPPQHIGQSPSPPVARTHFRTIWATITGTTM